MKTFLSIILLLVALYLLLVGAMFLFQRSLLYYPVPHQEGIPREEISFENDGLILHGWILNKGQSKALIYFGGNSEAIQNNIAEFEVMFKNHTVYLVHYRGYGKNKGQPNEAGLFSDALFIYDALAPQYQSISIMGRSLGSGVAVYLASKRKTEKLILLTPYDSIAEVAQVHYPFVPARYVMLDRFESFVYAPKITAPVLVVTAELDQVVPVEHALKLLEYLTATGVEYQMIKSAAHNDVTEDHGYQKLVREFMD